jgi:hypothetical protein
MLSVSYILVMDSIRFIHWEVYCIIEISMIEINPSEISITEISITEISDN